LTRGPGDVWADKVVMTVGRSVWSTSHKSTMRESMCLWKSLWSRCLVGFEGRAARSQGGLEGNRGALQSALSAEMGTPLQAQEQAAICLVKAPHSHYHTKDAGVAHLRVGCLPEGAGVDGRGLKSRSPATPEVSRSIAVLLVAVHALLGADEEAARRAWRASPGWRRSGWPCQPEAGVRCQCLLAARTHSPAGVNARLWCRGR
jgi:hypothetical protein